ncbi:MAG: 50S ribosomal protein L23 [Acidiferrobacteraceae bacterium]|jgi:large subunit ribosomal protein L23
MKRAPLREEELYKILIAPHISEKGTRLAEKNRQFVFKVRSDARKPDIRRAVEKLFQVEVQSVQVANLPGKAKRTGQIKGWRQDMRKAYVRLKPGFDIQFVSGQ